MMCREKRKSATAYLATAVVLACYLAHTVDCYRLTKTGRREWPKEVDAAKTVGVQEGKIVFGSVSNNGSHLESQDMDGATKASSSPHVEDGTAYQADFAGWSKGQTSISFPEAWKRMAHTLHCGRDQMRFRAVGPGASQFALEQGNAPPLPLSQVPSTCGYRMHRNSFALVLLVPYDDGCNVIQKGGGYMLPMRWHGIPVSLWCPKPEEPTPTPVPQEPQMLEPPRREHPHISYPRVPLPYFYPPYFPYPYPPFVTQPTTAAPTTTENGDEHHFPMFPWPYHPHFHHPWSWPDVDSPKGNVAGPQWQFPGHPFHPHPFPPCRHHPIPKPTEQAVDQQRHHFAYFNPFMYGA